MHAVPCDEMRIGRRETSPTFFFASAYDR
jgi:hypothetical protein